MKKVKLFVVTLIFTSILIGCHSYSKSNGFTDSYSNSRSRMDMEQSTDGLVSDIYSGGLYEERSIERKIIFSAYLSLTVKNPDTTNSEILEIAKKYNGYVSETGTYRTTIRVKSENFDAAVEEIIALGKVDSKNISGQDVTEDYLDFQIRLDNAEKARKRYLELLAKAENVDAALKVEKELERLNVTIDLLKGKMNRMNHLSEYSTISVRLTEKKKPGIIGYVGIGLYRSIKWLFIRN